MTRLAIAAALALAASACVFDETYVPPPLPDSVPELVEDRSVYDQDLLEVLTMQLTITDLAALDDVEHNLPGASVPVLVQEGTFGAGLTAPNGTLQLRGSSSRFADQHSYKIRLSDGAWRGMSALNLLKHPFDLTRLRSRLSLAYMRTIPNFTSMRTQWVHVFLNGVDYGLFENVENPSTAFLAAHGLLRGELYKANNFAFYPLTDQQLADPAAFELILETKGDPTDHTKVAEMLRDINDPLKATDWIIAKYFNRENYVTWLAINLLMGNFDTSNQNFLIYNPAGSDGWYLLPWDYDGAWGFNGPDGQPGTQDRPRPRIGLSTWWLSPLHQRFIRDHDNIVELEAKMDDLLATVMSDDQTRALLAPHHDLVKSFISVSPDVDKLPAVDTSTTQLTIAAWEAEVARIGGHLTRAYDEYYAVRDRPMPIFLADPERVGSHLIFRWDRSYDLQGDPLVYDLEVSRTPMFAVQDLVIAESDLTDTVFQADALPPGQYFWRVIVRPTNDAENWQQCAEVYYDANGQKYPGVRALTLP